MENGSKDGSITSRLPLSLGVAYSNETGIYQRLGRVVPFTESLKRLNKAARPEQSIASLRYIVKLKHYPYNFGNPQFTWRGLP